MSVDPGKLLREPTGNHGLNRKIRHGHRRLSSFVRASADHLALDPPGEKRRLAHGFDGKLSFGRIKHWQARLLLSHGVRNRLGIGASPSHPDTLKSYPARTRTWNEGIKIPSVTITPRGKGEAVSS